MLAGLLSVAAFLVLVAVLVTHALSTTSPRAGSMAITTGSPAPPASCHARDSGFLPDPVCTRADADSRVTPDTLSTTICRSGYTSTVRPPVSVTEPIESLS
jgi:hypothetical protein